jgi:hypothetical protein
MWKGALGVGAVFLALAASAASPALESDGRSDAAAPAGDRAAGVAAEVRELSRRVSSLERRVEELEARHPPPEKRVSAKIERERRAEFLQRVWTDG